LVMSAFDPKAGFCYLSGPPAPAAPFAPQMCFQTAYVPETNIDNHAFAWDSLNCVENHQVIGACSYDEECGPGRICDAGFCRNANQVHAPHGYFSSNPRVLTVLEWNKVRDICKAMGPDAEALFESFAKQFAYGKSLFLVKLPNNGQVFIATPLNAQYFFQEPNCSNCLKTLFQCSRFADKAQYDTASEDKQLTCQQMERAFLYDTLLPNGVTIPIMIKMDPLSLPVAEAALQKCAQQCGGCQPLTPMALYGSQAPLFY
jgi:hypothetical protein